MTCVDSRDWNGADSATEKGEGPKPLRRRREGYRTNEHGEGGDCWVSRLRLRRRALNANDPTNAVNASERDWLLRQQMREQLGYSMTKRVTEVHNQIFHCLSSQLFELGCANSMLISLHWNHQDALLVQKHSLVFSFAHSLLSACVVAETSTH